MSPQSNLPLVQINGLTANTWIQFTSLEYLHYFASVRWGYDSTPIASVVANIDGYAKPLQINRPPLGQPTTSSINPQSMANNSTPQLPSVTTLDY